jgi:hypothetical protein
VIATQPAKCQTCHRVTATHAAGCSMIDCPNRHPQVWDPPEGAQGFPAALAEDRILVRRAQRDRFVPVDLEDL